MAQAAAMISLPVPAKSGQVTLEQLLSSRRSIREYRPSALSLVEIGQLLWAAQGITSPQGYRTAPSAGALYPLEIYLVVGQVQDLPAGVYHYKPAKHGLQKRQTGDWRRLLAKAALHQDWLAEAAAVVVLAADFQRTMGKYAERGERYVHIEVGHAAQNLFLQAGALKLSTVVVGAFMDEEVAAVLGLPPRERPLLLMPVGR
jgi:SagB-type dehydrogenase family enzyme